MIFLLKTGDSTRSLLTPLYASDYDSFNNKDAENLNSGSPENSSWSRSHSYTMKDQKESQRNSSVSKTVSKTVSTKKSSVSKSTAKSQSIYGVSNSKSTQNTKSSRSKKTRTLSSNSESTSSTSSSSSSLSSSSPSSDRRDDSRFLNNSSSAKYGHNSNGKTWEDWLLQKTIGDVQKLKIKREEKRQCALKKRQVQEENNKREMLAFENRQEWIKQKTYAQQKTRKEKDAQKEFEKLKEKQEKGLIELKSKERYKEWYNDIVEKEKERRRREVDQEKKTQERFINKKNQSEDAYLNWIKNAQKREKLKRHTYGYSGGNLFSYYDMSATPPPSYVNPVPWVNALLNEKNERNLEEFDIVSSPPMMWKDVAEREKKHLKNKNITKFKRSTPKHSCE